MDAYYKTEHTIDGRLWRAGEVVRLWPDTNHGAFGDAVILGFNDDGLASGAFPTATSVVRGQRGQTCLLGLSALPCTSSGMSRWLASDLHRKVSHESA